MSLYRAKPSDGCVWITGGSTGIGLFLADELARRGYNVAVSARNFDTLDKYIIAKPSMGEKIVAFPCDVTNAQAVSDTLAAIDARFGRVVLAVLNAGTYIPQNGNDLSLEAFQKTMNVNFLGVANALVPLAAYMRGRGGQIAITASVTSYAGLPTAAPYGASKAALNSMAQSLKFDFDRMNIRIQVCNPGFVRSELTRKNKFQMPGLMKTADAAKRYADGLARGGFEIRFPRRLVWPLKLISLLPSPLYFWLVAKITGADKPLD